MADDNPINPVTDDMFAGLKRKKKKAVNFDEDLTLDAAAPSTLTNDDALSATAELAAAAAPTGGKKGKDNLGNDVVEDEAPAEATADVDMFADVKRRKKKRVIPMDLDAEAPAAPAAAGADDAAAPAVDAPASAAADSLGDFGDLKRRKKGSKKKAAFDLEAFEKEIGEAEGGDDDVPGDEGQPLEVDGDLGDDVFGGASGGDAAPTGESGAEAWIGTDRDYTYPELLNRFYHLLHSHNPELAGDRKKLTVVPPIVNREGTKKTVFANLADICKRMHRQPKHVMEFLFAELGTSGSVDGSQRLIIKGRYTQKSMENVLRRYIVEYVVCKTCKSPDTLLNKENRLYFITCESCGSRRSVTTIKTGFQAQIGKRSKTKPVT